MIGRKTTLAFANMALGAVLGLVALKVTALYFGIDAYGQYQYAFALLGILALLVDLNLAEAHIKRVSEGWDPHDCFVTFAVFKTVSTLVFLVVSLGLMFGYVVVLGKPLESLTLPVYLGVVAYYAAKSAMATAQSTFEAKTETARAQIGGLVETVLRVLLVVVGAGILLAVARGAGPLAGRLDPSNPLWAWGAANPGALLAIASFVAALVAAGVSLSLMMRTMRGRGTFRWEILRSYVKFALPLFLVASVGILSGYIDRAALGFFGSEVDVSDLAAPRTIVGVLEGIGAATGALLFPTLSSLLAAGRHDDARGTVDQTRRYLSMIVVPIVAFLVVFPVPTIRLLLADDWEGSGLVLSTLAVWMLILTLSRPLVDLLMGMNRPDLMARVGVTTALVNIVLVLILVPDDIKALGVKLAGLHALGAAIALLASGIVYAALLHAYTRSVVKVHPLRHLLRHLAAAAGMAAVLWAIDQWTPFHLGRWYTFPAYIVAGFLVYVLLLMALRELTREDVRYAQDSLHPGEMLRYVRSELGQDREK